ncbi:MAG: response regulator [Acidobacteria bacterium]|nr:response regulator [Acidobacteriota bacterium]
MTIPPAQPSPAPVAGTILIVEDHALVAKFYRMALERAGGFLCIVTENVAEILASVESGRVDLAILDISLRGSELEGRPVDGLELARLIRKRAPQPLPIVLATAHAMVGDRERLLETSGADAYLEKPVYDAEQLVSLVRRLISERNISATHPPSQVNPEDSSNSSGQN